MGFSLSCTRLVKIGRTFRPPLNESQGRLLQTANRTEEPGYQPVAHVRATQWRAGTHR